MGFHKSPPTQREVYIQTLAIRHAGVNVNGRLVGLLNRDYLLKPLGRRITDRKTAGDGAICHFHSNQPLKNKKKK